VAMIDYVLVDVTISKEWESMQIETHTSVFNNGTKARTTQVSLSQK